MKEAGTHVQHTTHAHTLKETEREEISSVLSYAGWFTVCNLFQMIPWSFVLTSIFLCGMTGSGLCKYPGGMDRERVRRIGQCWLHICWHCCVNK